MIGNRAGGRILRCSQRGAQGGGRFVSLSLSRAAMARESFLRGGFFAVLAPVYRVFLKRGRFS
ncbi:hypothetical protein [Cupriavidus oxalaticus]|jgi:hypothetical protein|uniref:hypothetical protein n=1 Tax=Cupriavidus oxalaticus TaxID=96344 RepID=UPI0012489167|nr:hypothetical protein [Cupriavidus oxalaticus]